MAPRRRLRVDWPACRAHGLCAELVPELVSLDEWGYPIVADTAVPPDVLSHAQRAVAACPTLALVLVEDRTPTGRRAVRSGPPRPAPGSA